jgi:hypothetical protein
MACHEDLLAAVQTIVANRLLNRFTIPDAIAELNRLGTQYSESTVRTHIASRCCVNAPDNHAVTYEYFERIDHGIYALTQQFNPLVHA